jgi:hypothetical protein
MPDAVHALLEDDDGYLYCGGISKGDPVCRSPDGGLNWHRVGDLYQRGERKTRVNELTQSRDGRLLAAGWSNKEGGFVFRSDDRGAHWEATGLIMSGDAHAVRVYTLLEAMDGSFFIGTQTVQDRVVYRSTDNGSTWVGSGTLPGARETLCLLQIPEGTIFAGTTPYGSVFKLSPRVSISIVPNKTVVSPGRRLKYGIMSTNNSKRKQTFDAWTEVFMSGGKPFRWNPVRGPKSVTLPPGKSKGRKISHRIPWRAPFGTHRYVAKVGIYPDQIWSQDSFEFEVIME